MKPKWHKYCAVVLLLISGCAAKQIHPNAVSPQDSQVYDGLLVAKGALERAREQLSAGDLPQTLIPAYNEAVTAYEATYHAWLVYRGAFQSPTTEVELEAYLADMVSHSAELTRAVRRFLE